MSNELIVDSWRDPVFRSKLSSDTLEEIPTHPSGEPIKEKPLRLSPDTPTGTYSCCNVTSIIGEPINPNYDTQTGTYLCCPGCR